MNLRRRRVTLAGRPQCDVFTDAEERKFAKTFLPGRSALAAFGLRRVLLGSTISADVEILLSNICARHAVTVVDNFYRGVLSYFDANVVRICVIGVGNEFGDGVG